MPDSQTLSLAHLVQSPRRTASNAEKPPLLLLLHGVGSNENDLIGLAPYLDGRFTVVSARAPNVLGPGAFGWYPVVFTNAGPVGDMQKALASRDRIVQFIEEAVTAYGVDPARVYLMGFSQGAIMSLYVALTHPKLVAGIVPMSGRLVAEAWNERAPDDALSGLPVFAVHGTRDTVLPVADGRHIKEKLSTLPLDFTYKEYNMAHEVSNESLADVTAWLTERLGPQ